MYHIINRTGIYASAIYAGGGCMDFTTILLMLGAVMLYIILWLLYKPLKIIMKYIGRSAAGCIGIIVFNFIMGF